MGGSRCAFVQGEIRIVGFTEGSKSAIIYCLTVSILQWFTREQAHTCLTLVRLLTESCIYKNLFASLLWISGSPVKQVGHLRGIDLLQDPIDPKELVSSLRTKASCFGVLIPRSTGVKSCGRSSPSRPFKPSTWTRTQTQAENLALANTGHDHILWVMNRQ